MAQAAKTIAKPIKALVILFLADSEPALSPPETIHCTPPITSMKKKSRAAITKSNLINPETIPAKVRVLSAPNGDPVGILKLIVGGGSSAKTADGLAKKAAVKARAEVTS